MPGPKTLMAISREFDVSYETLLAAIVDVRNGKPETWVGLIKDLTETREPATV